MRGIDAVVDARSVQRRRERGTAGVLPLALLLRTMLANAVKTLRPVAALSTGESFPATWGGNANAEHGSGP